MVVPIRPWWTVLVEDVAVVVTLEKLALVGGVREVVAVT